MKALILAAGLLFTGAALAAGTATYRIGDMSMDYAWRGDALRIDTGEHGYMLLLDGEVYMVSQADGRTRVMAMSDLMSRFGNADDSGLGFYNKAESFSLEPTGRSETVAGLTGEVYTMTVVRTDGSRSTGEIVLSDHPLAVELSQAFLKLAAASTNQPGAVTEEFLTRDRGWLRIEDSKGDTMVLTAISGDTPPASIFELPAEPMQMPDMGGAGAGTDAGAAASADTEDAEQGGGFFGGLFGGLFGGADDKVETKAERQRQRQSGKVEQRVDEETDNVVDKAVEGLMDSLFGG